MTIQKIAQKQFDRRDILHFARKGTSDCYWFEFGVLRSYSDTDAKGRRMVLDIEALAATDWQIFKH